MAAEWPVMTVAECASDAPYSTQIGPFGKALMADEYTVDGVPVLRGVNVNRGRFHDDDFVFIDDEKAEQLHKFESFPGDVLLVHKGTLGRIGLMPSHRRYPRYILGNSMMRVSCNPDVLLPEYLYYWLSSADGQNYLMSRVSQVGVPQLQTPLRTLREAALPVPSVDEQQGIVSVLTGFDAKIENLERRSQTLEAVGAALFKAWFVEFEPVRAKTDGRDPGIPAAMAELFSDRLVDSELGDIPEGWEVRQLQDLLELSYGKALKAGDRRAGEVPVYGSNGQVGWHDEPLVSGPGIVVGRKGNPGKVTWASSDFFVIDTAFYVVPRDPVGSLQFLFHALRTQDLALLAADSAVPGLNRNAAYMSLQVVPPTALLEEFETVAAVIAARIHCAKDEARTLAEMRDALMPQLIGGKLRLADYQQLVDRDEP